MLLITDRAKLIKEYLQRKGKEVTGFELGVSGGIDSAVVLMAAVDAVGKENVHCILMPHYYNNHFMDAIQLVKEFEVDYKVVDIKPIVEVFCNSGTAVNGAFNWSDTTVQNLMARVRMCLLYAEANEYNRIVLGTCNLDELAIGFFTKHGDGASDIEPLACVVKKHVYDLAKLWNASHPEGPRISENILTKAPTPDLHAGQTDEQDMGTTYKILDKYLEYEILMTSEERPSEKDRKIVEALIRKSAHKKNCPGMPEFDQNIYPDVDVF